MTNNNVLQSVPRIDEYFGVWAIAEMQFQSLVDRCNSLTVADMVRHLDEARQELQMAAGDEDDYGGLLEIRGDVAVISLIGTLMKFRSSFGGTSTVDARRAIRAMAERDDIQTILLRIDSPGGTAKGTADLASEVQRASGMGKRTVTYFEDLGASAAYWVGSQAQEVVANSTAMVGSIGTFAVVRDSSAAAEAMKLKIHVIRAGEYKGMGTPGTQITDAHLAEMQRTIDQINDAFIDGVASGRRMDRAAVSAIADGRIHIAPAAQNQGLIDRVESFDDLMTSLVSRQNTRPRSPFMSTGKDTAPAVTIKDLSDALPKASDEFLVKALREGWGVAQAKDHYLAEQEAKLQAMQEDRDAAIKQAEEAKQAADLAKQQGLPPTTAPVSGAAGQTGTDGDPIAAWNAVVKQYTAAGLDIKSATRRAVEAHPDKHKAYLAAWNQRNGRHQAAASLN